MSLPASFLEELRARSPLVEIIGRKVRLVRSGRNWRGCCPLHGEKTPSFYVYTDHFHCFGCGAHGDAISFLMQSEGAQFLEAVTRLAGEAGMQVPAPNPERAEHDRARAGLRDVLDAAAAAFCRRLHAAEGQAALAYLHGRGLSDETLGSFGIGWSGDGRGGVAAELRRAGFGDALQVAAGLLREGDDGKSARELFYGRIMFPIRNARGDLVSFGGRVLGDGQPKYLNGPETAIFHKGATLYGLDRAHRAVRAGAPLLVVEGYLDVIALHAGGFAGAVAPLGTAVTEAQLSLLWRLSPVPVMCFDGDKAGERAAERVIDLALPGVAPDRSLRIAGLPAGADPDSLLRDAGAPALQAAIDAAKPLCPALYDMLARRHAGTEPEQRAALRAAAIEAAERIADRGVAGEYRRALLDRFYGARIANRAQLASELRRRLLPMVAARLPIEELLAAANGIHDGAAVQLSPAALEWEIGEIVASGTRSRGRRRKGRAAA